MDWSTAFTGRKPSGGGGGEVFAPALLPDMAKEQLCRELLAEFGVISISQRGDELTHRCVMPWHDDSKPSASLNYTKLTYKCLSCNSSGGLLWLIATVRGVDSDEARAWANTKTNVTGGEFDLKAMFELFDAIEAQNRVMAPPPMPKFSPTILKPWQRVHPWLTDPWPSGRGIPYESVVAMNVGYDAEARVPVAWDDNGVPSEWVTSERIIIPHFWRGDLVGWQSRRLTNDGTPKYKNTGDFPRDRTIYDYDPKRRKAVWCESPSSVLRHRHHQPMEASFGSAVTEKQARLLAEHDVVVLWPDNDEAGWKAVLGTYDDKGKKVSPGLVEMLEPYCSVLLVDSPWAADPADMDDDTVDALVAAAVPPPFWEQPKALTCWLCKEQHDGNCDGR